MFEYIYIVLIQFSAQGTYFIKISQEGANKLLDTGHLLRMGHLFLFLEKDPSKDTHSKGGTYWKESAKWNHYST